MAKINTYPEIRFAGFTEDWEERELGDVAKFNPKHEIPDVFNYVDLESVVGTEMISYRKENKISAPSRAQRLAEKGDVFYQTVRPYQKNNLLFDRIDKDFVFSTGYAQLRPIIESSFLFTLIQKDKFVRIVLNNCTGTSYPAINSTALASIKQYLPKSKDEQKLIGDFFENIDSLITEHQQKHLKLKSLKQAMLDKMFPKKGQAVPEIRFRGFTEKWDNPLLRNIGNPYTGLSGKNKIDFGHGEGRYITYMNVYSNPISDNNKVDKIEIDSSQNEVISGDVLFTISSETAAEVGMSSVWTGSQKNIYLNSFCFGYRPKIKLCNYFLANLLRSKTFREQMILLAQGISRYNISKNKVMNLMVSIPQYDEQVVIGEYFKNLELLIRQNNEQTINLSNLKKAFLTKMFI